MFACCLVGRESEGTCPTGSWKLAMRTMMMVMVKSMNDDCWLASASIRDRLIERGVG